ncbi:hypothetical protein QR680_017870 [Steinernema hermaphroditum]|uniref:Zinc finger BED domain-containing protein 4 n=1 Tax=Steinernema hermaphroditum TaxID=289476 RepID=A0AA39HIC6_9BILA|nr:hypothetical protein QR680_017870 [Steinernema hermaphroditum]
MDVASFDCFSHKIQLAINEGIKIQPSIGTLIGKAKAFVRTLRKAYAVSGHLRDLQKELDLPDHCLIQHIETRWNSAFYLLERLVEQREAITILSAEHANLSSFTKLEWSLAESLLSILKPFEDATKELGSRSTTIASVIPTFKALIYELEAKENNLSYMRGVKDAIKKGLERRMQG